MLRKVIKGFAIAVFSIPVVLIVVSFFAPTSYEPVSPPVAVREAIQGRSCKVTLNENEIPRVRAESELVGFACLGYLQARDRGWQMDYFRRVASGRSAEVFGYSFLRTDFFMRMLELRQRAETVFRGFDPDTRNRFWAYAYGVNRGFERESGGYEFDDFGYRPEPWHPAHSVSIIFLQAFQQTKRGLFREFDEAALAESWGGLAFSLNDLNDLPWQTTILKKGEYNRSDRARGIAETPHPMQTGSLPNYPDNNGSSFLSGLSEGGEGSNNWVISPERSETPNAWLANDPHLALKRPLFWYWVELKAGDLEVFGGGVPGIPFISTGTNRRVSWGVTNSYLDVFDTAPVRESELGSKLELEEVRPTVWMKFWKFKLPFVFLTYKKTKEGWPLLPQEDENGNAIAFRWSGFDLKSSDFRNFASMMKSENVQEMDSQLAGLRIPSWNFVFADVDGQIGYRAIGLIPQRSQEPSFGMAGDSIEDLRQWRFLEGEEMPHVMNPKRGYVVTANNPHWPQDSSFRSGRVYYSPFRAFRIEEQIEATPKHDLETQRKIQCDIQSVEARFFLPELLRVFRKTQQDLASDQARRAQEVIRGLEKWDYRADLECRACGFYRSWMTVIEEETGFEDVSIFHRLSQYPDEGFEQSVVDAFWKVADTFSIQSLEDFPKWGEFHLNPFSHFASSGSYDLAPIPTPGDESSVNPGNLKKVEKSDGTWFYHHTVGASQRMIVEMSKPPRIHLVLPGTNIDRKTDSLSGENSPWVSWRNCELRELTWSRWDQRQTDSAESISL